MSLQAIVAVPSVKNKLRLVKSWNEGEGAGEFVGQNGRRTQVASATGCISGCKHQEV